MNNNTNIDNDDNDNDNEIDNNDNNDIKNNDRQYNQFSETLTFICISTIAYLYILYDEVIPYMDEIFHVPQAQEYCNGNFSNWNDKITTFPGLYYISYMIDKIYNILNYWFGFYEEGQSFCSYQYLRYYHNCYDYDYDLIMIITY